MARVWGVFLALAVALQYLLARPSMWTAVREPYCVVLAQICGFVLRPILGSVTVFHHDIAVPNITVSIVRGCDGLDAMAIFAAAVLAFPAAWMARGIGIGVGLTVLFVVNLVRIVVLVILGAHVRWAFEMVHLYVFQVSIIAAAFGCFVWWLRRLAVPGLAR